MLLALLLFAASADFVPMSVWYGGGKARAPMLEPDARAKKEIWRRDVSEIKRLGFNSLRMWIDWATGQPAEDKLNLETLDVMLELAEEQGLKLLVQVYMDSAPEWVGRKFPDSLFVSSNGMAIRPESSPGYCRDHSGVMQAELAFYAALAERAKRSSAFFGWDLWSEPHVINWANPAYIERPEFCFCSHTKARFREWLKKKYGSLDGLNRAWYRRFSSWDEVEPNRLSTILSYTDYIDWKAFIAAKLGEDLRARFETVKRFAPNSIATSHAAGVGVFSSPHYWEGQSDDWVMASQVDYYGTSFYPKHSGGIDRDVWWRGALLDFTRSFGFAGTGRGFYIGELQGGFGTVGVSVGRTVTPEDLRVWTWSALARGAKGISYYAWYPMSSGYESGGFGLINLDGTITERARTAGEIARVVDRHQKLFFEARPPRAEVAIVYNPLSHFVGGRQRAAPGGGPQGEAAGIERDSLLGAYRALFSLNIPADFVHIDRVTPAVLTQYKLLIFPYPLMMPERAGAALEQYVRAGGTLISEARLGWNNERGQASEIIPGMGLHEVMGTRETAVETAAARMRWHSAAIPGIEDGLVLPGRSHREVLQPLGPQSQVAAVYENGEAAAILSRFGKGKTLMLGSYVLAAFQTQPSPPVERFFQALVRWAGIEFPIGTAEESAEVRWLESGSDRIVFVFNHGRSPIEPQITMRGAENYSAMDLVSGVATPVLRKRIAPQDVWVVKLTPRRAE
jgi:beta-galactosidase